MDRITSGVFDMGLMHWFRIRVIGGDTGATEGSWFLILVWIVAAAGIFGAHLYGYETERAAGILEGLAYALILNWQIAHGLKRGLRNREPTPPDPLIEDIGK